MSLSSDLNIRTYLSTTKWVWEYTAMWCSHIIYPPMFYLHVWKYVYNILRGKHNLTWVVFNNTQCFPFQLLSSLTLLLFEAVKPKFKGVVKKFNEWLY